MGGPPVVAYWLGGAIPAAKVRANIVLFFATSGVISMIVYLFAGLLTGEVLVLAALMAPGYALGLWCGSRMFGRASEVLFRRTCFGLIALAAVIGLPVGFVGAAESKQALAARHDVPWMIVEGRLGGSAMAVAAVNALASERE